MADTKTGSKTNLNESSLPLLGDDGEKTDKETIELKEQASTGSEKDDSKPEKTEDKEDKKDKKKKKKEPKEKKPSRSASCYVQTLSVGLNVLDRDDRRVNEEINITFEDVLAEPDSSHGFDGIWRLSYVVFNGTKYWVYRVLAAIIALPLAVLWGLLFAFLTLIHIWLVSPLLKVLGVLLFWFRRVWTAVIRTILEPLTSSVGALLSQIRITHVNRDGERYPTLLHERHELI